MSRPSMLKLTNQSLLRLHHECVSFSCQIVCGFVLKSAPLLLVQELFTLFFLVKLCEFVRKVIPDFFQILDVLSSVKTFVF